MSAAQRLPTAREGRGDCTNYAGNKTFLQSHPTDLYCHLRLGSEIHEYMNRCSINVVVEEVQSLETDWN
jgi:hypothetical protein